MFELDQTPQLSHMIVAHAELAEGLDPRVLFREADHDSLAVGRGDDDLFGSADSDTLRGDDGNDDLAGGTGMILCRPTMETTSWMGMMATTASREGMAMTT